MMSNCELFKIIPKKEINRVFKESYSIAAECDHSFLGFEDVYKAVSNFVPEDMIIVDLGCAYAAQAFYFLEYEKYIGVENGLFDDIHFETPNMVFYKESIQEFISKLKERNINASKCFAICSYVPDKEAEKLVRNTFPKCLVYYPQSHNKVVPKF